ncbi:MAG: class I SAM-dependent methyltransferase [Steroidobacteraceae bacterium]
MNTVADHYEAHLAPVYLWMSGGVDAAIARGDAEIAAVLPNLATGTTAVDLGAGFGMHAIPLGRRGCTVVAVDSSALLLEELRRHAAGLPVSAFQDDLLSFQRYVNSRIGLIMIMGDTLTHLPDPSAVQTLMARAAQSLGPGGQFIATFRDYTAPLAGAARFIPVRSDENRILTCFLEYGAAHVDVHDLLYERRGPAWQFKVSSYRKLRLSPAWVAGALDEAGFSVRTEPGVSGMVRLIATRV